MNPDDCVGNFNMSSSNTSQERQLLQLQQEIKDLTQINQLLIQKDTLKREVQQRIDKDAASSKAMDLGSLSKKLQDDIHQLQSQKNSLMEDVNRLRLEEGARNNNINAGVDHLSAATAISEESNHMADIVEVDGASKSAELEHVDNVLGQAKKDALITDNVQNELDSSSGRKGGGNILPEAGGENSSMMLDDDQEQHIYGSDTQPSNNMNDIDDVSESRFSERDDEDYPLVEDDAVSDAVQRAVEQSEMGRNVIDEDDMDDKSFELCCVKCSNDGDGCVCGEGADNASLIKIREILPSHSARAIDDPEYYVRMHRPCCTTIHKFTDERCNYAITNYSIAMSSVAPNKKRATAIKVDRKFLLKATQETDKLRTKVLNDLTCKDPVSFRGTDERYAKIISNYQSAKQRANSEGLKAANVLSLFSGIGGGIQTLKRLRIDIDTLIVVEHDPIAETVCSGNHKSDVMNYIWIETFEELEEHFDDIMEKYAPINIVEGGPPCTEYSPVNANRAGVNSTKGQYMVKFAQLIQKIRNHPLQKDEEVFFLCENVALQWPDQKSVESIFGISPIEICAQQVSPNKRNRGYYTNLPVNELPGPESEAALSTVHLDDGWMHPAQLHCLINNEPTQLYCKAQTLMASEKRIDHPGMIKVRLKDVSNTQSIETSFYSVADREALLGFPTGYVENKVKPIFEKLCASFHSEDWVNYAVDNEWDLEGMRRFSACNYKFTFCDKEQSVTLKFGTVEKNKKGKTLYYYDCEGYCKRVLGNSYSIPVVEHLLKPVKELFLEREYQNAEYNFAWETSSNTASSKN